MLRLMLISVLVLSGMTFAWAFAPTGGLSSDSAAVGAAPAACGGKCDCCQCGADCKCGENCKCCKCGPGCKCGK